MSQLAIEGLFPTKLWFDPVSKKMAGGFRAIAFNKEAGEAMSEEEAMLKATSYQLDFSAEYADKIEGQDEHLVALNYDNFKVRKYKGITSELTDDHGLTEEDIEAIKPLIFERLAHAFHHDKTNRLTPLY